MKFSTRTTYGLRAMIKLAANYNKAAVSLAHIAKKEKISQKYLERLFVALKKEKLVLSEKGASGGYRLARDPKNIRIYDIVRVLEGEINPFHCVNDKGEIICSQKCHCGATAILIKVQGAINSTLQSMKLSDLL
ncbi:MAG TPA: Rrf2 family transcriptional regulator [bacterium]|nr:Rrf2 family transcriptional regulator [bacterium]